MAGRTDPVENCFTGNITSEYVNLANQFTQDLSSALLNPMWLLFMAFAGLWIAIQGLRLSLVQTTLMEVSKELVFVIIAAVLLSGQGPELVNTIYSGALSMMGSAATVALSVGEQSDTAAVAVNGSVPLDAGMHALVCTAEKGVKQVFYMGSMIAKTASITDPMPWLYALVLVLPYFLVLVVYFSQVVVSIFRVMMIATLSPYLMLGFGFGWGRDMMKAGVKTLLSSFMVLFGATAALAVMIYGISNLDIGDQPTVESVRDMASITDEKFLLALAMGWLGTAFMTEATGIANSISGSVLSNTAAGIITAGATATAMILTKNPISRGLGQTMGLAAAEAGGNFVHNAAHGAGYATGVAGAAGQHVAEQVGDLVHRAKHNGKSAAEVAERMKNVIGD